MIIGLSYVLYGSLFFTWTKTKAQLSSQAFIDVIGNCDVYV